MCAPPSPASPQPRSFDALAARRFEVLVIGGGVTGAGVARDLALRGASVALVEQDDFASGTSSRSTKLIHGGLRYLEQMDFGLVFEACRERHTLQHIAPHLVRPLPLMIPLYHGARRSKTMVRAGLTLYDLLALFRNTRSHQMLSAGETLRRQPLLNPQGLTGAALYWDCRMDDARLCLENVIAAREAGAVTVNYARATAFHYHRGHIAGAVVEDRENGRSVEVTAQVTVNAGGPWLDRIGALSEHWTQRLRPTRGSHLLVPRLTGGDEALYLSADRDDRMFFVIPWGDLSLIGTTDIDDDRAPETVSITPEEIAYLLTETDRHLPAAQLSTGDVVSSFAGIRPLLAGRGGAAGSVSREHAMIETPDGLIAVGGGKYTIYRAMAAEVTDLIMTRLGRPRGRCRTAELPLPGGGPDWAALHSPAIRKGARHGLSEVVLRRLVDRYGARTSRLLSLLDREPVLAGPLVAGLPLLGVEVAYAIDFEMARTPEDILRRRTPLALGSGHGLAALEAVTELLGCRLALTRQQRDTMIAVYRSRYSL